MLFLCSTCSLILSSQFLYILPGKPPFHQMESTLRWGTSSKTMATAWAVAWPAPAQVGLETPLLSRIGELTNVAVGRWGERHLPPPPHTTSKPPIHQKQMHFEHTEFHVTHAALSLNHLGHRALPTSVTVIIPTQSRHLMNLPGRDLTACEPGPQ